MSTSVSSPERVMRSSASERVMRSSALRGIAAAAGAVSLLVAGLLVAVGLFTVSFVGDADAAGNAARVVPAPADLKECKKMVGDTREMLNETEVSAEVDSQVEALIKTASDACTASSFDGALGALMQARKLLGG
jgi:hypothetical protein